MKKKVCFFIGSHDTSGDIFPLLLSAAAQCAAKGAASFIVGNYGAFDRMAARAVITLKAAHPDITLSLLSPYHPCERKTELPSGFDEIIYPFVKPPPKQAAIVRANHYAVSHSDYLIAHVESPYGNSAKLLQYAKRRAVKHPLEIIVL